MREHQAKLCAIKLQTIYGKAELGRKMLSLVGCCFVAQDIWAEVQIRHGLSGICTSTKENTGFPMLETGHPSSDVALWNCRLHTWDKCVPEKEFNTHSSYFISRWDFLKPISCFRIIFIILSFYKVFVHFSTVPFHNVKKALCDLLRFHEMFWAGSEKVFTKALQTSSPIATSPKFLPPSWEWEWLHGTEPLLPPRHLPSLERGLLLGHYVSEKQQCVKPLRFGGLSVIAASITSTDTAISEAGTEQPKFSICEPNHIKKDMFTNLLLDVTLNQCWHSPYLILIGFFMVPKCPTLVFYDVKM